jgi:hypothetical protein
MAATVTKKCQNYKKEEKKIFEKVYRRTDDRCQVMAISHMASWPGELKKTMIFNFRYVNIHNEEGPADLPTWLPLLKVEHRGKVNKKFN